MSELEIGAPKLRRDQLLVGAAAGVAAVAGLKPGGAVAAETAIGPNATWAQIRGEFNLAPGVTQLTAFLLASHPRPVRAAIDRHRRGLDANPHGYLEKQPLFEDQVLRAAASYLRTDPQLIALTDSTTMGLGLLYRGLRLRAGDELLTSTHDFYSTHESLRLRAEATGATLRKVPLYRDPARASVDEIVSSLAGAVKPATRVIALTWVHSSTGVKLPLKEIATLVRGINAKRGESERALLCVDGVHGFGVEATPVSQLGCDFFASGTHKWLFGPRGTGVLWGTASAWARMSPIIPSFDRSSIGAWLFNQTPSGPVAPRMTPGGFHSFEHRWALADAFAFRSTIGAQRVERRTHQLATRLKAGLKTIPQVTLKTPVAEQLSAGLVCFTIDGVDPNDAVRRLASKRIVASATPYATQYVRLGPTIVNTEADIDRALAAVRSLA